MKIGIAARLSGGVGVYGRTLIAALLAADPDLRIALITPDPVDLPGAPIDRLSVHRIRHVARIPTHPGWILHAAAFRHAIGPLLADLQLVHFTDARHALFSTGLPMPVIGTMNDYFYAAVSWNPHSVRRHYRDWVGRYAAYNLARVGERMTLRRLSRIIAISNAVGAIVGPAYQVPASRFCTVPYGLDFSAIPPNDGAIRSPRTVLFVGGNFQRKGLHVLLNAAPSVLARFPDTRLIIIGASVYAAGARRLARDLHIDSQCEFLGAISHRELLAHYGSATVLAMPSLIEAFAIPYLEAMSCGLPVIATACRGPDEYLVDGRNALVVPPGDVDALSAALRAALGDTDLRERLRVGGKATAAAFTTTRMAHQTLAVYRDCLRQGALHSLDAH